MYRQHSIFRRSRESLNSLHPDILDDYLTTIGNEHADQNGYDDTQRNEYVNDLKQYAVNYMTTPDDSSNNGYGNYSYANESSRPPLQGGVETDVHPADNGGGFWGKVGEVLGGVANTAWDIAKFGGKVLSNMDFSSGDEYGNYGSSDESYSVNNQNHQSRRTRSRNSFDTPDIPINTNLMQDYIDQQSKDLENEKAKLDETLKRYVHNTDNSIHQNLLNQYVNQKNTVQEKSDLFNPIKYQYENNPQDTSWFDALTGTQPAFGDAPQNQDHSWMNNPIYRYKPELEPDLNNIMYNILGTANNVSKEITKSAISTGLEAIIPFGDKVASTVYGTEGQKILDKINHDKNLVKAHRPLTYELMKHSIYGLEDVKNRSDCTLFDGSENYHLQKQYGIDIPAGWKGIRYFSNSNLAKELSKAQKLQEFIKNNVDSLKSYKHIPNTATVFNDNSDITGSIHGATIVNPHIDKDGNFFAIIYDNYDFKLNKHIFSDKWAASTDIAFILQNTAIIQNYYILVDIVIPKDKLDELIK